MCGSFRDLPVRQRWSPGMSGKIAAVFLVCAALYGQTAEDAFRRALTLHQSGDLRGAIDAYQECLRLIRGVMTHSPMPELCWPRWAAIAKPSNSTARLW